MYRRPLANYSELVQLPASEHHHAHPGGMSITAWRSWPMH
ncbi:TraI domain-containing protein [Pseudomonas aeruginosa]